ncbi:D-alanine--D-alanine ligase A, partial [Candidatus Shapirobacteria bacterium CG09_land_8_20_14_0_10_47_13]
MKKLRVAVLMGGKSPEHEVSLVTGREVVRNLDKKKYEVLPVVISSDGDRWQLKPVAQILLHSPAG